ncbi:hypothetical protein GCM10027297_19530 [Parahaliea aestuarii]
MPTLYAVLPGTASQAYSEALDQSLNLEQNGVGTAWSSQDLVETDVRLLGCSFKFIRADASKMLMSTSPIVERVDVI